VRTLHLAAVALLATLLVAPGTEAALNHARPYQAQFDYLNGLNGSSFTMASGAVQASLPSTTGAFGFIASQGADLTGLTRVCWTGQIRQCADSSSGALSVHVDNGGSFGIQLPGGADATLHADHALALFTDLSSQTDLNGLGLGKSLLAPLVGGVVALPSITAIPASAIANPASSDGGAFVAVDANTALEVRDGQTQRAVVRGKAADPVTFAGAPVLTPVHADLAVLPFQSGADAHFVPASKAAADVGLDIDRINRLMDRLYNANEGQPTQAQPIDQSAFGPFRDAADALFAGAVLSLPTSGNASDAAKSLAFARTPVLVVRSVPGGLSWTGKATLDVRGGHVVGAPKLYGWTFLSLPWWGWMLWAAALGVWITRLVLKPEKHHPVWDRFKWIGWVAGPLALLLVAWMWDLEVRAVFGFSLFTSHLSAQMTLVMLAVETVTFLFVSFAAIAPLRMIFRNSSLLLRQGTFMGLSGAVASLLGFLIGARLLMSELDLVISQLVSHIS
jgi:hypothetical protein